MSDWNETRHPFLHLHWRLTLQGHSAVFRELIWVKQHRGWSLQGVLDVQHILVLKTFVMKVEIPTNQRQHLSPGPQFGLGAGPVVTIPVPSFVGAAIFRVVIELGQTLAKAIPDTTLLQEGHGQFVLLLHKSLQWKGVH